MSGFIKFSLQHPNAFLLQNQMVNLCFKTLFFAVSFNASIKSSAVAHRKYSTKSNHAYLYQMKQITALSRRTFWDVDLTEDDLKNSSEWIILRVFDRGTLDEVIWTINHYGFDFVKQTMITTTENLPNHAILLARAIFKLSYTDFKCSERKPFQLHC